MARLITNHDPYHIHKVLGLIVLVHFLYRTLLLLSTGDAFPPSEPRWRATLCVLLHGVLSWSSLLLPLPAKRNYSSPMIWPEFRFHSIVFATRHVVCTILTLNDFWPTTMIAAISLKLGVVLATILSASKITDHFGDRERRTTNAMPYPAGVEDDQQRAVKLQYAVAQIHATQIALLPDATLNWFPLLAIQAAPFLMTLVRKGIVGSWTYHRVYAFTLWVANLAYAQRYAHTGYPGLFIASAASAAAVRRFRLLLGWDKHFSWCVHVVLTYVLYPLVLVPTAGPIASFGATGLSVLFVVGLLHSMLTQIDAYAPLYAPLPADEKRTDSPLRSLFARVLKVLSKLDVATSIQSAVQRVQSAN